MVLSSKSLCSSKESSTVTASQIFCNVSVEMEEYFGIVIRKFGIVSCYYNTDKLTVTHSIRSTSILTSLHGVWRIMFVRFTVS